MNNLPKNDDEKAEILSKLGYECHYLMAKPVDDWDEYDESNWNAITRDTIFEKPRTWIGLKIPDKTLLDIPDTYRRVRDPDFMCRFGRDMGTILYNGDLTSCTCDPNGSHVIGNIFETGSSLWDSSSFNSLRQKAGNAKLDICSGCGYNDHYVRKVDLR